MIAMVCRHRGARVIVSEVNPFRIDLLRGLGLEVIGMDADPVRFVNEWFIVNRVDGGISWQRANLNVRSRT